jgi:hypothetical protein
MYNNIKFVYSESEFLCMGWGGGEDSMDIFFVRVSCYKFVSTSTVLDGQGIFEFIWRCTGVHGSFTHTDGWHCCLNFYVKSDDLCSEYFKFINCMSFLSKIYYFYQSFIYTCKNEQFLKPSTHGYRCHGVHRMTEITTKYRNYLRLHRNYR